MIKKAQYTKKINKIKNLIKTDLPEEAIAQLKAEKQALERQKKQLFGAPKRKKYTYRSEATRQASIQRGKQLRAGLSPEAKAIIEQKRIKGLEAYRTAQRIAKTDEAYKKYWEEIKAIRKQARRLGKSFSIENISASPTQIKEAPVAPEISARYALGLATRIDVSQLLLKAEEDGIIKAIVDNEEVIGYTYDGKGYSVEDMMLMLSSPKKFFPAKSLFWNWINTLYWQNGGGDDGAEAVAQEVFGS